MDATFEINLEYIAGDKHCHTFRLAFDSSDERLLLSYPDETGIHFTMPNGEKIGEWGTQIMGSCPLDDFVLTPSSRIAFDVKAHINQEPGADSNPRWAIQLPVGTLNAQFVYTVNPDLERLDFLAKRSRFAAMTKPWGGSVKSNVVQFTVTEPSGEQAT